MTLSQPENKKEHKYIAKVNTPSGKVRYFYNEEQWKRYQEIRHFQDTEPEFMKDVPEIEPTEDGTLPTKREDQAINNPAYGKDPNATVNCFYCTLNYILRRQGYDTYTKPIESVHNAIAMPTFFDIPTIQWHDENTFVKRTYDTITGTKKTKTEFYDLTVPENSEVSHGFNPVYSLHKYPVSAKEKAELFKTQAKSFGDGTYGSLSVHWKLGGGHSMVWSIEHGDVVIRDTQTNTTYIGDQITELFDAVLDSHPVNVIRLDNAKPKKGVLAYVSY